MANAKLKSHYSNSFTRFSKTSPHSPYKKGVSSEKHFRAPHSSRVELHTGNCEVSESILLQKALFSKSIQQHIESTVYPLYVTNRDINLQLLLHLPKYPLNSILQDDLRIKKEMTNTLVALKQTRLEFRNLSEPPPLIVKSPKDTIFSEIDNSTARIIHEHYHYIGSYREQSLHYGLRLKDHRVATLLSFSRFDLKNMIAFLPDGILPENVMVLSRGFSFDWGPANAISYLMAKAIKELVKENPKLKMLVTYVNPNLSFTGAAYKAANWVKFGVEQNTHYKYLNGRYITDRKLVEKFGTATLSQINNTYNVEVQKSQIELLPLIVYSYFIEPETRRRYANGFYYRFER